MDVCPPLQHVDSEEGLSYRADMTTATDPRAWVDRPPLELPGGTIDFARSRFLRADGGIEPLSAREAELLAFLADRPNQIVSRDLLLAEVWGHSNLSLSRAVDTAVARLRRKIEPDAAQPQMLFTDHGYGYRLLVGIPEVAEPTLPATVRRLLRLGEHVVDLSAGHVDGADGRVALTAQERLLLEELLRCQGAAVEVRKLARKVGIASVGAARSAIHRLRQKIEREPGDPRFLLSVSGSAYRLAAEADEPSVASAERLAALHSLADHIGHVLGFVDCVVYLREGEVFRQVAAFGPKRLESGGVRAPMVQRFREGLVGWAAADAEPIVVSDVHGDTRYIEDVVPARAELAVPVLAAGHVVGVIDAESPRVDAFLPSHLFALVSLATIAAPAFARLQGAPHG